VHMIGGKKNCEHSDLVFIDGAYKLFCNVCKAHWIAINNEEERDDSRKKQWIQNPRRTA
jgi:hypothetical protein